MGVRRPALQAGEVLARLTRGLLLALLVLLFNLGRNPIPMLEDNRSFGLLALYFMAPAALIVAWL